MLEEMRALAALADTGSFTRAAIRLSVTPSAATRMVQRLESSLAVTLLDRTVKPPRFTPVGRAVLEHARDILARVENLNAAVRPDAQPLGELRIGISHALADSNLAAMFGELRERFPQLRLRLSCDFAAHLTQQLLDGELHAAAFPVPPGHRPPPPLHAEAVAEDQMRVVAAANSPAAHASTLSALGSNDWVLNPPGCLLRGVLLRRLAAAGLNITINAEVHNPHLQASLVTAGYGLGFLSARHARHETHLDRLVALDIPELVIPVTIVLLRATHLGRNELAVTHLARSLAATLNDQSR